MGFVERKGRARMVWYGMASESRNWVHRKGRAWRVSAFACAIGEACGNVTVGSLWVNEWVAMELSGGS